MTVATIGQAMMFDDAKARATRRRCRGAWGWTHSGPCRPWPEVVHGEATSSAERWLPRRDRFRVQGRCQRIPLPISSVSRRKSPRDAVRTLPDAADNDAPRIEYVANRPGTNIMWFSTF
jgi:hypothetical protein